MADFWSYFFPFERVVGQFERAINAWIVGEARIAVTALGGRVLQSWEDGRWRSVYWAGIPFFGGWHRRTIQNCAAKAKTVD